MNLKNYLKNEVLIASVILIVLSNLGGLINLAFQFIMARLLSSDDFGALAFLTNLIFLFGVPALAIQTAISKKTLILNSKSEYGKIKGLFFYSLKKVFLFSIGITALFISLAGIFYRQLGMRLDLLILASLLIFLSLIYPVVIGLMQGMKKFVSIGWNIVLVFSVKLIVGVLLVLLGFRVYGALMGIILGMIVAIIFGVVGFMRFKEEKEKVSFYSSRDIFPFVALLIITLIYSIDILLGKFVFTPDLIGSYSKISLLAKIILFACLSIGTVMFPLSIERHLEGDRSKKIMIKASFLALVICSAGLLIFHLFSNFIISLLFGTRYLSYASLLLPLAIAFSFIAGINLIVLYSLSREDFKIKQGIFLILSFLIQFILLIINSKNINQFTNTYAITSGVIFILLLILNLKWKR